MDEQATHSLRTEILMDLGQTTENFKNLSIETEKVAGDIGAIADSLKDANDDMKKFSLNLGDKIAKELESLKGGTNKVNGSKIVKKIEDSLTQIILSRDLELTGVRKGNLKLKLDQKFWDSYQRKVKKAFQGAVDKADIDTSKVKPFPLTNALNYLQKKVNTALEQALDGRLNFEEIEKNNRYKNVFKIKAEHMNKLMLGVRDKFIDVLSQPEMIDFEGLPKLTLSSKQLQKVVKAMQDSVGDIDKQLSINVDALKDIPNVSAKMKAFDNNIKKMIQQIITLSDEVSKIDPSASEGEMKAVMERLQHLRKSVVKRVSRILNEVTEEVGKMPISTIEYANYKTHLDNLGHIVNNHIQKQLMDASVALNEALGASKATVEGKEVFIPSVKAIQEKILMATQQAFKNIDKGDYNYDLNVLNRALQMWQAQVGTVLEGSTKKVLAEVGTEFVATHNKVLEMFRNSIKEVAHVKFNVIEGKEGEIQRVDIPMNELRKMVIPKLREAVKELIATVDFATASKEGEGAQQVKLPKEVSRKVRQLVKKLVGEQADMLVAQINQSGSTAKIPKGFVQEVDSMLDNETRKLVDTLLERTRNVVRALKADGNPVGALVGEAESEQKRLQQILGSETSNMIKEYINTLQNSFGSIALTSSTLEELAVTLEQRILLDIRDTINNINFKTSKQFEVDLDEQVAQAIIALEDLVEQSIARWTPSPVHFNPSLDAQKDGGSFNAKIKEIQKQILDKAVADVIASMKAGAESKAPESKQLKQFKILRDSVAMFMEKTITELSTEVMNALRQASGDNEVFISKSRIQKMLQPLNDLMANFMDKQITAMVTTMESAQVQMVMSTAKLNAEVRKRMAQDMEMTVADFKQAYPTLEGEGDLKNVLQYSLQTIADKFNEVVMANTDTAIRDYKGAMEKVKLEPDISAVHYLTRQLNKIQEEIARKVKSILQAQFKAMTEQIRNINLYPISIGYQPTQATQQAVQRAVPAPSRPTYGSTGIGSYDGRRATRYTSSFRTPADMVRQNPGGDTRSFMGSVINTIRYMTAGMVMGAPMMAMHEGWNSAKQFDYELAKAQQNFIMKDPSLRGVASKRVYAEAQKNGEVLSSEEANKRIEKEARTLKHMARDGAIAPLQNIALAYGQNQEEVGLAYHIASRSIDDPYQAIGFTKEIAKLKATENVDMEVASKGLQSIKAQWGVDVGDIPRLNNMLIQASTLSNVTAEDLLQTQQRSGAMFRQVLPGMSKEDAFATSLALSSLFTEATARSGNEGGTFFKTVLQRPYKAEGREILEEYSQHKGFENLNPWVIDEHGNKEMKDYTDLLGAIMEASDKMDAPSREKFLGDLFNERHGGSAKAIMETLDSMKNDIRSQVDIMKEKGLIDKDKKAEEISYTDVLKAYTNKIKSVSEDDITGYIVGLQDTYQMQQHRLKTAWQTASFGVFEEFKDEFSTAITYLTTFLGMVQKHTHGVANMVGIITKLATIYGAKNIYGKIMAKYKGEKERRNSEARGRILQSMEDSHRSYRIRRAIVGDQIADINAQLNLKSNDLTTAHGKLSSAKAEYNQLKGAGAGDEELQIKQSEINSLTQDVNRLEQEIKDLEREKNKLGVIDDRLARKMSNLEHEMNSVAGVSTLLDRKFNEVERAMAEAGIDTYRFSRRMRDLQQRMNEGKLTADQFQAEIKQLGRDSGMSEDNVERLVRDVQRLNNQFARGAIDARVYANQLRNLRGTVPSLSGTPGGGGMPGGAGSGSVGALLETILAGGLIFSGARGLRGVARGADAVVDTARVARTGGAVGLFGRAKNLLSAGKTAVLGTKLGGILAGAGTAIKGTQAFGKVAGLAGKAGSILKFAKWIPFLGQALMALDLGAVAWDALSARTMTKGESLQVQADKRKDLAQQAQSLGDSGVLGKVINSALMVYDGLLGSASHLLGGNAPSFKEYLDAFKLGWSGKKGDELKIALEDELGYNELARQAKVETRKEYLAQIDPFLDESGNLRRNLKPGDITMSVEDTRELLSRIDENLQNTLSKNDSEFTTARLKLLMSGASEDNAELKKKMKEYLDKNIEALEKTISGLITRMEAMDEGESRDLLEARIAELEAQKLQAEYEKYQTDFSALEVIMKKFERDMALTEAEYSIKKSEAEMKGATDESPTIKSIESAKAKATARRIESTQAELRKLLSNYKEGTDKYNTIWLQIMQLEADQKSTLADIAKMMKRQQGTFNLPSGIKPITYWEATTKNNTHKNMTVRSGDVTINVNIDRMSGDTKDIEKVTTAINQAVRDTQKNLVNQFARDVKSGMGSNYHAFNQ